VIEEFEKEYRKDMEDIRRYNKEYWAKLERNWRC